MSFTVDIHADDYGYSINTSKDLLEYVKEGYLNSISLIPNMPAFSESVDMLYKEIPSFKYLPLMSVHINLVEGTYMDSNSNLPYSWGKLFLSSYPINRSIFMDIKKQIRMQILCVDEVVKKCVSIANIYNIPVKQKGIRLDSHVHTHLIPIVWKALTEVIEEEKLDVEFIRNPKEPLYPFMKQRSLVPKYNIVNMIKNRVLMFYSGKVDRYVTSKGMNRMYMWGLIMSGEMDLERVERIYPDMKKYCEDKNRELEILFHPGLCLKEEKCLAMNPESSVKFNMSDNRKTEANAVINIASVIGD